MLSAIRAIGLQAYAAGLRQAMHAHDTASVTLVVKGRLRETVATAEEAAGALSLVVKPAGVKHADLFGPERVVTCQIVLDASVHAVGPWTRALARWGWLHGGPPISAALTLTSMLRRADVGREERLEAAVAVLDALAGDACESPAPAWLPLATDFLRDQVASGAERVRVTAAARAAGVHPVHLTRVFRAQFGCTVSSWVRRLRVQRAAHHLERSTSALSGAALAAGFADQSHMNRTFRREAAILPRDFRALVHEL